MHGNKCSNEIYIVGLKHKVKTKFEIEKYVNVKNNILDKFKGKWETNGNLLLNI